MNDQPRILGQKAEQELRQSLLNHPHIKPLTDYVLQLTAQELGEVPFLDPLDGGINAEVLFLMEKPGPQADASGFISRNNDDPTANYLFEIMQMIDLPRHKTCIWNIMPYWNGTIKIKAQEHKYGLELLKQFIALLPSLKVVVLVGKKAQMAEGFIQSLGFPVINSFHPSPKVKSINPEKWQEIPKEWAKVFSFIEK